MENIDTLLAAVAQTQGFDDEEPAAVSTLAAEVGLGENWDSPAVIRGGSGEAGPSVVVVVPKPELGPLAIAGQKRKRGRYGQLAAKPLAPKLVKPEDEEEDVCFICFDGGSLVLCDRKGCPKAYHPVCIKRDEAFFQSTARWYCGWHICSVCRKASHYFCYTCSFSLCKGCLKDADYSGIRRNKGFCSTCMKTIMLLENNGQANNESIQVDFDDKTSWEYLFKVYWVILKDKLSLTLDELTRAQNPWKDFGTIGCKPPSSNVIPNAVRAEVPISHSTTEHSEPNKPHVDINLDKINSKDSAKTSMNEKATDTTCIKDKATHEPGIEKSRVKVSIDQDTKKKCNCKSTDEKEPDKPGTNSSSSTEWATKDLLEFVAHTKNGDTSALSQFDVQMLLLDYIKRNNLRDPHRKSQIICDQRLRNLFGKPRAGHIEMLKLLESHFLVEEDAKKSSFILSGLVSSVVKSEMSGDGNAYELSMPINSRKRKTRKKSDEKAQTQNNLKEYAAINLHNINLVYLQRNLMENLLEDHENFDNKVIGSIVRIRISSNDQKQDVHRLVQVVGTTKVGEPYKIGDKTTDVMLEVLNLDKKEVVSIDAISNHEFTEDECRRLRQSIRCGLVKQFTVGEVQNKAIALQPVRVNDCLEAEILRLNHLRDRASENGRKKELREYVGKLLQLKSPGERIRRTRKIPEIHSDPKMSPNYESEEDIKSADNSKKEYMRPSYSGVPQNGRKLISPYKKDKEERTNRARNRVRKSPDATGSNSSAEHTNQVIITNLVTGGRNNHHMRNPGLETSTETASVENSPSSSVIETEKSWHYCDPNGKIQGPFSMMQLRKWSTTGLFPPDMRIWTNHEQKDSLLLTDAFNGKFNLAPNPSNSGAREEEATGEIRLINEVTNVGIGDSKQMEPALGSNNNVSVSSESNSGLARADESGSWPQCWDLFKDNKNNSDVNDVQVCDLPHSSNSEKKHEDFHHHGSPQNGETNSKVVTVENLIITSRPEQLHNRSNNEDRVGLANEENLRSVNINMRSNDMECRLVHAAPSPDKPNENLSISDLPSPIPETVEIDQSGVPMKNFEILELLSTTPKPNNEDQLETETKQSEFINFPVPNSGPIWSGASSLAGVSEVQLPEVANEWCGYSPTPAPPPLTIEDVVNSTPNEPNWRMTINGTIELDALSEESVSDLLAEVDAMNLQGASLPSPTSAMKFARELMEEEDDCFSSIEFNRKSDTFSCTGGIQLTSEPYVACKPISNNTFDFPTSSSVHSSLSSEGETTNNAPLYSGNAGSLEFHPGPGAPGTALDVVRENVGPVVGSDSTDPGWCSTTVQGNINLVTVQGNVNLVLGQGMAGLGWGTNQGTGWVNPNLNPSSRNGIGSLPWDRQRMYGGERFSSPREWGGYQGVRGPWGRQPQYGGGGGYSRQIPKGQRVCKFYESGHCKKGGFCNYLHP